MGVTCRACLEGPWYHKPHAAVGEKCYKHMISTGSVSSPLSVAALRKKGDAAPARTPDREADEEGNNMIRAAPRPLSEKVRFETREGNVLLYDPSPLDKWIGTSCRWDSRRQLHVETNTGDVLSAEDSEDYQRYVQRHNQRRQTGNQADELIKLVATHNPAVEAELRFYIANFPGEVRRLLAEGKQVYKPLVDKRRHGGTPSAQTAEPRHQRGDDKTTKKENEKQKQKKGEKAKKHKKHEKDKKHKKAKKSRQDTPSGGEATAEQQQPDDDAAEPPAHEEVDWGSEGDDTDTQPAVKAKAVVGENGSDDSPPVMSLDAKWPWGEQGRPSDMASSS
ncbi:ANK2, partial [Symbiodinium sp. KB8]